MKTNEQNTRTDFTGFPKMARLFRDCVITEKIDGTNAQVVITHDGEILAGSRTRWITPEDDNFGFAAWVRDNAEELRKLGPGRHFGEWWGRGIQRNYGLDHRRFSLFNVLRWHRAGEEPRQVPTGDPRIEKWTTEAPGCCHVVPILYLGNFSTSICQHCLVELAERGSRAAPNFADTEGIVTFHIAANVGFKTTIKNDEQPKGKNQ